MYIVFLLVSSLALFTSRATLSTTVDTSSHIGTSQFFKLYSMILYDPLEILSATFCVSQFDVFHNGRLGTDFKKLIDATCEKYSKEEKELLQSFIRVITRSPSIASKLVPVKKPPVSDNKVYWRDLMLLQRWIANLDSESLVT